MSNNGRARVHYFQGQFLRTQDFSDEQAYHLALHRRHQIAHHTWGIVQGLELEASEDGLSIQPGVAVDGYGRTLVLANKTSINTARFDEKGTDRLDVWLVYDRVKGDPAPEGYAGCGEEGERPRYRAYERPLVRVDIAETPPADRRAPPGVPEGDRPFAPHRTPPDDPHTEWPVFLGQIERNRSEPGQPYTYTANQDDRPYAGLRGEYIVAPSGQACVQIGAEKKDDARRFAVFVPEADQRDDDGRACRGTAPRLEIDKEGGVNVRGSTTVGRNLKLEGGALEFGVGTVSPDSTPAGAWRIYRQTVRRDPEPGEEADSNGNVWEHQLRIEMAGGSDGANRVSIGSWSEEQEKFVPCLDVTDNCQVTIRGDLLVTGNISGDIEEAQQRARAGFSFEAQQYLAGSTLSGISGASTLLERFYPERAGRPPIETLLASEAAPQMIAEHYANDPGSMDRLIEKLLGSEVGMDAIGRRLAQNRDIFDAINSIVARQTPDAQRRPFTSYEGPEEE